MPIDQRGGVPVDKGGGCKACLLVCLQPPQPRDFFRGVAGVGGAVRQ